MTMGTVDRAGLLMAIMRRLTSGEDDGLDLEGLQAAVTEVQARGGLGELVARLVQERPVDTAAAGEDDEQRQPDPGSTSAPTVAVLMAGLIVVAAALVAWWIYKDNHPDFFAPKSDYSVFAGLFIVALAIERLIEPFTKWLPPDTDTPRATRDRLVAHAERSKRKHALVAVANAQAELDRRRAGRAVVLWGIASALGMTTAAALGLFLLRSVTEVAQRHPGPNRFLDVVVTGLAIGAGTKPLHELTSRITVSKQQAKDPPQTAGTP